MDEETAPWEVHKLEIDYFVDTDNLVASAVPYDERIVVLSNSTLE